MHSCIYGVVWRFAFRSVHFALRVTKWLVYILIGTLSCVIVLERMVDLSYAPGITPLRLPDVALLLAFLGLIVYWIKLSLHIVEDLRDWNPLHAREALQRAAVYRFHHQFWPIAPDSEPDSDVEEIPKPAAHTAPTSPASSFTTVGGSKRPRNPVESSVHTAWGACRRADVPSRNEQFPAPGTRAALYVETSPSRTPGISIQHAQSNRPVNGTPKSAPTSAKTHQHPESRTPVAAPRSAGVPTTPARPSEPPRQRQPSQIPGAGPSNSNARLANNGRYAIASSLGMECPRPPVAPLIPPKVAGADTSRTDAPLSPPPPPPQRAATAAPPPTPARIAAPPTTPIAKSAPPVTPQRTDATPPTAQVPTASTPHSPTAPGNRYHYLVNAPVKFSSQRHRGISEIYRWFGSYGDTPLDEPRPCPREAILGDVFIHKWGAEHVQAWMWRDDGWAVAQMGQAHPTLTNLRLKFEYIAEKPQWIAATTWARLKKKMGNSP